MPDHDDALDALAQGVQCKLDATHADVAQDVAGDANDEKVVEALPEEHLQRYARVGAADDNRERRLLGHLAQRPVHADFEAVALHDVPRLALGDGARPATFHPPGEHPVAVLERFPGCLRIGRRGLDTGILGIESVDVVDCIHGDPYQRFSNILGPDATEASRTRYADSLTSETDVAQAGSSEPIDRRCAAAALGSVMDAPKQLACSMALSSCRDDPGGDAHGLDQARWIGQAFPGDVESGAVGHAGADDRQAQGHIDGAVEADGLERDVPLVVVHRHDGVVGAGQGMMKQGVVGERTGDVDALTAAIVDGRADDRLLLIAEEPVLAGVRVERRRRRSAAASRRSRAASPGRPGGSSTGPSLGRQQIEHLPKRDVQGHVDHAQARSRAALRAWRIRVHDGVGLQVEHHRVVGHAAAFRQDLGVTGMADAALVEGLLVER